MSFYQHFEIETKKVPAEVLTFLKSEGVDIGEYMELEIGVCISGGYYRATLESPAEYPDVELDEIIFEGIHIIGELEETVLDLVGGRDSFLEEALDAAEEADADAAAEAAYDDYMSRNSYNGYY